MPPVESSRRNWPLSVHEQNGRNFAMTRLVPLGQRLGQCGDGELLLVAQDRTDSTQNVPNLRRGQS